jgi:hypothetical protein
MCSMCMQQGSGCVQVVATMFEVSGAKDRKGASADEDAGTGIIYINRADPFSYRYCHHIECNSMKTYGTHLLLCCLDSDWFGLVWFGFLYFSFSWNRFHSPLVWKRFGLVDMVGFLLSFSFFQVDFTLSEVRYTPPDATSPPSCC